jgi:hypothetical protein
LERSTCVEAAIEPHRTGRMQKATKPNTFPVMESVIEGRTTNVAISSAVITNSAYSKLSGDGKFNAMPPEFLGARPTLTTGYPAFEGLFRFGKFANIAYKLLDLIVRQLSFVRRHFLAFAIRRGIDQLRVGLFLHLR